MSRDRKRSESNRPVGTGPTILTTTENHENTHRHHRVVLLRRKRAMGQLGNLASFSVYKAVTTIDEEATAAISDHLPAVWKDAFDNEDKA